MGTSLFVAVSSDHDIQKIGPRLCLEMICIEIGRLIDMLEESFRGANQEENIFLKEMWKIPQPRCVVTIVLALERPRPATQQESANISS